MSDSGGKQMRLALVIEAIDKASEKLEHINQRVNRLMQPINRVTAASKGFAEAAKFENIAERYHKVGEAMEGVEQAGMKLFSVEAYAGAAGGALVELFHHVSEVASGIERSARMAGMGNTEFQKLAYGAKLADVSQEELAESMAAINRNAVEALRGNTQLLGMFHAIGISWNDLKKDSPEQLFYKISDWMQKFPNEARKGDVAMTLAGRGSKEMIGALSKGPEYFKAMGKAAQDTGKILSDEAIEKAGQFDKSLKTVGASLQGILYNSVASLMPKVEALLDRLDHWIDVNRDLISGGLTQFLDGLISGLPTLVREMAPLFSALMAVLQVMNRVAEAFGGWDNLIVLIAGVRIASFIVAIGKLLQAVIALDAALLMNPLTWIPIAIVALYELYKHWDTITLAVSDGIEWVMDKVHSLLDLFGKVTDWFSSGLPTFAASNETAAWNTGAHVPVPVPAVAANESRAAPLDAAAQRAANLGTSVPTVPMPQAADQGKISLGIDVPTVPMMQVATMQTPAAQVQAAAANSQAQKVDVSGNIHLQLDHAGRTRVKSISSKGPVDISVSHGPMAMGAAS